MSSPRSVPPSSRPPRPRPGKPATSVLLAHAKALHRMARRLNTAVNEVALRVEDLERELAHIQRQVRRNAHDTDGQTVFVRVSAPAADRQSSLLQAAATRSPIESLVWSPPVGRRAVVAINGTEVPLAKRLDRILAILASQPASPDGLASFISYELLGKQISTVEGRRVRPHALSQSLSLLAAALQAHGLNPYWLQRDPGSRRVRLLVRRPDAGTGLGLRPE